MKKEAAFSAAIVILVLSMVLLASCTQVQPGPQPPSPPQVPPQQEPPQQSQQQLFQQQEVKVEAKPYKYVTEKPTGWFRTGQEADVVLYATDFNESGGSAFLNHPSKIATDGKRLIVSDTWNHRVLIWNEIPAQNDQKPDLVLGQPDFESNLAGIGADRMNWPIGVATDGRRLLVGDGFNDRVLIWSKFPTKNGQTANLVLGADDFDTWPVNLERQAAKGIGDPRNPKQRIYWPWDVWTNGEKVVVTSTVDGSVLVWNSFPTRNNQAADIVLGQPNFETRFKDKNEIPGWGSDPLAVLGTPRAIASDGQRLVIGDYSAGTTFVWNGFPTKSGQPADFGLNVVYDKREGNPADVMGATILDGSLFAASVHKVLVWKSFPTHGNQEEDFTIGSGNARTVKRGNMNSIYDVETDGKRLFVADSNNNRVLIWNKIPESNGEPDIILGQPGFETNRLNSRNSFSNPVPYSDGERLFIGSDFYNKIAIYKRLPNESKAEADVVIDAPWLGGAQQITSDGQRMMVADRGAGRILIWNNIPEKDNQVPDVILGASTELSQSRHGKGKIGLNSPVGVATDRRRLFVSDKDNNRILIWNQIPTENQTPADFVLGQSDFDSTESGSGLDSLSSPNYISTDGKRLVVADSGNRRVLVWNTIPATNKQPADFSISVINHSSYDSVTSRISPTGAWVYDDRLFVVDGSNNRVVVWSRFPKSETDEPDIVLGQKDFGSTYPVNSKDRLHIFPSAAYFDGSFLWVGETKWSNRLLRFSVQPS